MKFHKATLVGLSETSASLTSVGRIDAKEIFVGGIQISASTLQFYDTSSQEYVTVLSPLSGSAYLTTSSVENFPMEVSRSAAEFGFGSGGGGGGDTFPYTGRANIYGTLNILKTTGLEDEDPFIVKGDTDEGTVKVNTQGILQVQWSGSNPPIAVEGGMYYSQSAFFVGL